MECFQGLQVKDPMGKMEDKVKAVENILEEAKDLASADDDEFENILSVFDWQVNCLLFIAPLIFHVHCTDIKKFF